MKTTHALALTLLRNQPLTLIDAARLVLEAEEELGTMSTGSNRESLMRLMRRVIRAGISAIQAEEHTVSFEEAAWASIEARKDRREATKADLRYFVRRMLRIEGIAMRPLRAMTSSECRDLLEKAFCGSVHSYRKGRAILHSIFAFGYRREWCDANPVSRIEVPSAEEKEIIPLTPKEIHQLESTAAEPEFDCLQLPLHLMLYCGIRPAEVERINPQRDINWTEKTVTIRPLTSKTGSGRVIPLRCLNTANMQKFKASTTLKYPLALWRYFRRRAGFRHWVPDILRHTFATYHAAHFHNLSELQLEMGHRDASLLLTRYVHTAYVSRKDVRDFWRT